MSTAERTPPPETSEEHDELLAYLRDAFRGRLSDADCEDAVQQAYLQLLAKGNGSGRRARRPIRDRWGWLRTTAWRRADDMWRHNRRRLGEGDDQALAEAPAREQEAAAAIDVAAALARTREALAQLPRLERDAFRASYTEGLGTDQACQLLDVPRSTFFELRRRAREHLTAAALGVSERFDRNVIAMINAKLAGAIESADERRLNALLAKEPRFAALYRELRGIHDQLGATLPPLAVDQALEPGLVDRTVGMLSRLRDGVHGAVTRNPETVETAASPALSSSGGGKAGGVAAGGLGGALGIGGGAAKLALTCGGAAATAACVVAIAPGVGLPGQGERPAERNPEVVKPASKEDVTADPTPVPEILPGQVGNEASPPVVAEPAPTEPASGAAGPQPQPPPSEPVPAEESATSDFSFETQSAAPAAAPAPSDSTSGSTSGSSTGGGDAGGSGGGAAPEGGDFSFGQ